jgi:hypothetical protein
MIDDIKTKFPTEAAFHKKVVAFLKTLPNTYYFKAQAGSVGGIPDIICGISGKFVALELKRSKTSRLSALQEISIKRIVNAQSIAYVVHPENWDGIQAILLGLSKKEI